MMKRICIVLSMLLLLTGCVVVEPVTEQKNTEEVIEETEEVEDCLEVVDVVHTYEINDWTAETHLELYGEVRNNCDSIAEDVQLRFIAYDEGVLLADGYLGYPYRPLNIPANGVARFQKQLFDEMIVMSFDEYEVTAETGVVLDGIKIR